MATSFRLLSRADACDHGFDRASDRQCEHGSVPNPRLIASKTFAADYYGGPNGSAR
jgi:hypothetical protein